MDKQGKWNAANELKDTQALLNSGAIPDNATYSLDDIIKEFSEDIEQAPAASVAVHSAPQASNSPEECTPEVEQNKLDFDQTAAFIGQQVTDAIGEPADSEDSDSALDGFRRFLDESRRKAADEKLRRQQRKKEKTAAKRALEQAAEAAAEEEKAHRKAQEHLDDENIIQMPTSKIKLFRDSFGQFYDKLTDFADNMYSDAGTPEEDQTRAYITGTDEEEPEVPQRSLRERRPRPQTPQAPDISADELAGRYRLGLRLMKQRLLIVLGITLISLFLSVVEELFPSLPSGLLNHRYLSGVLTWLLAFGSAIELDVLWLGLTAPMRGRTGMHTLTSVAVLATLADGLYSTFIGRDGPLPFSAMALLSLLCAGCGAYQRKKALQISCKTVASTSEPYRITLDSNKWNGVSAFTKEVGTSEGFGSQIQGVDGAQQIYRVWVPVIALVAVVASLVTAIGRGRLGLLTWCLSTTFVAAAPLSGLLAFGMPYLRLTKRLDRSGAVLAGWEGVVSMTGRANVLLKDEDLFPEGSILIRSIKHFKGVSLEKLTGCTASMLRTAGTGLYHIFDDELRRQGGFYRRVDNMQCYEAGGLTADIRGDQVLVGTQGFLTVMNCKLEDGMKIRRAVYCVINKKLEGIFSLQYEMSHYARESVQALVKCGVQPVLVTRDFNVIPSMLETTFDLPVDQMEYPPIERRRELSEPNQEHNPILGAILTRSGMGPYSDAIIGGRRLYHVVRINAVISVLAALVGVILAFYLTWSAAFTSLTPFTMFAFLFLWLLPTFAVSGAVDKF